MAISESRKEDYIEMKFINSYCKCLPGASETGVVASYIQKIV